MANLSDVNMDDAGELKAGFEAIPPGWYQLYMESSEVKDTNDGKGKYLACVFAVGLGDHEGAKIFCNFNFWNESEKAVNISKASWRVIVEAATGMPKLLSNDSATLHNKTFMAEISNVPGGSKVNGVWVEDPSKRKNEIVFRKGSIMGTKEYYATQKSTPAAGAAAAPQTATGPAPAAQTAPAAAATPPVTPGVGKKPWDKR